MYAVYHFLRHLHCTITTLVKTAFCPEFKLVSDIAFITVFHNNLHYFVFCFSCYHDYILSVPACFCMEDLLRFFFPFLLVSEHNHLQHYYYYIRLLTKDHGKKVANLNNPCKDLLYDRTFFHCWIFKAIYSLVQTYYPVAYVPVYVQITGILYDSPMTMPMYVISLRSGR